jgi:hypothetical protein
MGGGKEKKGEERRGGEKRWHCCETLEKYYQPIQVE